VSSSGSLDSFRFPSMFPFCTNSKGPPKNTNTRCVVALPVTVEEESFRIQMLNFLKNVTVSAGLSGPTLNMA